MRLKLHFGLVKSIEVNWYKDVSDFPHFVIYNGQKWEWFSYDEPPDDDIDMVLMFANIPHYDPNWHITMPKLEDVVLITVDECECGAKYGSFAWDHMRFCKRWKPWSKL